VRSSARAPRALPGRAWWRRRAGQPVSAARRTYGRRWRGITPRRDAAARCGVGAASAPAHGNADETLYQTADGVVCTSGGAPRCVRARRSAARCAVASALQAALSSRCARRPRSGRSCAVPRVAARSNEVKEARWGACRHEGALRAVMPLRRLAQRSAACGGCASAPKLVAAVHLTLRRALTRSWMRGAVRLRGATLRAAQQRRLFAQRLAAGGRGRWRAATRGVVLTRVVARYVEVLEARWGARRGKAALRAVQRRWHFVRRSAVGGWCASALKHAAALRDTSWCALTRFWMPAGVRAGVEPRFVLRCSRGTSCAARRRAAGAWSAPAHVVALRHTLRRAITRSRRRAGVRASVAQRCALRSGSARCVFNDARPPPSREHFSLPLDATQTAHTAGAAPRHTTGAAATRAAAAAVVDASLMSSSVGRAPRLGGLTGHEATHVSGPTCSDLTSDAASTAASMDVTAAAGRRGVRRPK